MICPTCGNPLREKTRTPVTVDICQHCGGVWFDQGELHEFIRSRSPKPDLVPTEAILATLATAPSGNCPACTTLTLLEGGYMGITYSKCSSCAGIYLPAGETRKAAERLAQWKENPDWKTTESPVRGELVELLYWILDSFGS